LSDLAAQKITNEKDIEKEKLTSIGIQKVEVRLKNKDVMEKIQTQLKMERDNAELHKVRTI